MRRTVGRALSRGWDERLERREGAHFKELLALRHLPVVSPSEAAAQCIRARSSPCSFIAISKSSKKVRRIAEDVSSESHSRRLSEHSTHPSEAPTLFRGVRSFPVLAVALLVGWG